MSNGIQSDFLRETSIKNFIDENILGSNPDKMNEPNKLISKQLIQMILPIQKHPLKVLENGNQLIKYIRYNALNIVEEFITIYRKIDFFKLTKYGQYCAEDSQKYIIFSDFMVCCLLIKNKKWSGFCYHEGKSAYIGQFSNMLSDGEGRGLFLTEHTHQNNNSKKTIYHEYQGQWRAGQILYGARKSYQIYGHPPFMQYKGQFKNFCFHGDKGVLKTRDKTLEGRFVKGVLTNSNNSVGNS